MFDKGGKVVPYRFFEQVRSRGEKVDQMNSPIDMSLKNNFPSFGEKHHGLKNRLRNLRLLRTQPVGRPKDIISSIIVALGIASLTTMTPATVGGLTIGLGIGLTWAGITLKGHC